MGGRRVAHGGLCNVFSPARPAIAPLRALCINGLSGTRIWLQEFAARGVHRSFAAMVTSYPAYREIAWETLVYSLARIRDRLHLPLLLHIYYYHNF
jgi:hypothetical protein